VATAAAAAATDAVVVDKGNENNNWLESCRDRGFDPWHLACTTCSILKQKGDPYVECMRCCQPYKDGERQVRSKPYEAAVLVLYRRPQSGGELGSFLDEDWDGLTASKGRDRLVRATSADASEMHEMEMFLFHGPMAALYFLEDAVDLGKSLIDDDDDEEEEGKQISAKELASIEERAAETVYLDAKWKRDDLKDMIQTLLLSSPKTGVDN